MEPATRCQGARVGTIASTVTKGLDRAGRTSRLTLMAALPKCRLPLRGSVTQREREWDITFLCPQGSNCKELIVSTQFRITPKNRHGAVERKRLSLSDSSFFGNKSRIG